MSASNSTTAKSFVDSCFLCTTKILLHLNDCCLNLNPLQRAARYLIVTQCCYSILGSRGKGRGRGRAVFILIRNHLEHTDLLSGKRVNKGMERMTIFSFVS